MRIALALVLSAMVGLALGAAVLRIAGAPPPVDLPAAVGDALVRSGVDNPVTAVLLNFRAYDTLLEVAVLVIAGVAALSPEPATPLAAPALRSANVLLHALVAWFVPLMLVLAAYLVWAGGHRPGGAFQAGAVLAAAGVLMRLAGVPLHVLGNDLRFRAGLVLGLATFLLVALLGAASGGGFLAYPQALAGTLILVVEVLLALSIALVLLALFVSAPPTEGDAAPTGDERV